MDEVLIVTGASRGIGAATARLAAQRGYAVCVNYRHNRDAARGEPEEIARAILWLLSDEASYATGAFVDLAGGR